MALFALFVTFTDDTERRLATRPVHRTWLKEMLDAGSLHESGPFTDDSGALMIYNVESLEAAEGQLASDPYSTTGGIIANVEIREWNRVFPASG